MNTAEPFFARLSKVQSHSTTPSGEVYDSEDMGFHIGRMHRAGCHYLKPKKGLSHVQFVIIRVTEELVGILPKCRQCFPPEERTAYSRPASDGNGFSAGVPRELPSASRKLSPVGRLLLGPGEK